MTTSRSFNSDHTLAATMRSVGPVHFDGAMLDGVRAAQRAARDADIAARRDAMVAADKSRAARRIARDAKYFEVATRESDADLLSRLWSMRTSD